MAFGSGKEKEKKELKKGTRPPWKVSEIPF